MKALPEEDSLLEFLSGPSPKNTVGRASAQEFSFPEKARNE